MRFTRPCIRPALCAAALLVSLFASQAIFAQPSEVDYPLPPGLISAELIPSSAIDKVTLPPLDVPKLLEQDRAAGMKDQPLRFAVPQPVYRGLGQGGSWESLADGRLIWRVAIEAGDAVGVAPVFDRFYLPPGAELHLYSADGSQRVRPFTSADNRPNRELWAPLVTGERVVIELVLPPGTRHEAELHLSQVGQAYRDLWGRSDKRFDKSGACNIDVACDLGQQWSDEVRGIAQLQIGFSLCSGFLVNNTAENDRLLLMTANHCGLTSGNDQNVLAYWNYQNSTCRTPGSGASGGFGDGVLDQFTTGTTLLASDSRSDFTVAELLQSPEGFGAYLLGWDARKIAPTSVVTIHHPQGEEKRISRENDATLFDIYPAPGVPADTDSHIQVPDWDEGTTEGGSSGSPLLDESSRRVVGQLHGGLAACGNDLPDWYGAMWRSFELGLAGILDPSSSGALVLDGKEFGDGGGGGGPTCVDNATTLCLNRGRFEVKVTWRNFVDEIGDGQSVDSRTDDSGLFWFFGAKNWEVLVKVLDACDLADRYWVFFAATTNVEYTLTVTDTSTGESKTYFNPLGNLAQSVTDTDAFATCP